MRLRRYQEAHAIVAKSLHDGAEEPRFYLAKSMNVAAWLADEEYNRFCPSSAENAISDAHRALEIFGSSSPIERRLSADVHNMMAALRSDPTNGRTFNLSLARQAVALVKESVPMEEWWPRYPKYIFTAACLALQELHAEGGVKDGQTALKAANAIRELFGRP